MQNCTQNFVPGRVTCVHTFDCIKLTDSFRSNFCVTTARVKEFISLNTMTNQELHTRDNLKFS